MSTNWQSVDPRSLSDNLFGLVADDWMLITAGTIENYNTMTASWGAFGELWNKKIAIAFVRPTRHTYEFLERTDRFTLSFFAERYRPILSYLGRVSGRDVNKMKITGLAAEPGPGGGVLFAEARLALECRKLYFADLDPARFLDPTIERLYPRRDYHRLYIGEIVNCLRSRDS